MKKALMGLMVIFAAVLVPRAAFAETFTLSADIPAATGFSFNVFSVDADTTVFTPVSGTNLVFNNMTLDPVNGIYLPENFFAIGVAGEGGAGVPEVTITYAEGNNPNGTGLGLGGKSVLTAVRVEGAEGSQTEIELNQETLIDISGTVIPPSQIEGGFLRLYVGIATGESGTPGVPFSNGDEPGTYTGTLTLTATLT